MKITDVRVELVQSNCGRKWTHVYVFTDEGVVGVGEATYSRKEEVVAKMVLNLKDALIGRDAYCAEAIYCDLYGGAHTAYHTGGVIFTSAMSGVDQALWDIKGKAFGLPVCAMLGGPLNAEVPVYSHFGGKTTTESVARARSVIGQGFTGLKSGTTIGLAPGPRISARELRVISDRYAELRSELGGEIALMDDPHAAYAPGAGLAVAKALEPYDLLFLEEPTIPEDPAGYARIRSGTATTIAGSERLTSKFKFNDLFAVGAVDVAQPDVVYIGGITEMKKVAATAEIYQVLVAPHNTKGPVGIMAAAHVMAAIPNGLIMEMVAPDVSPWRNDILEAPLEVRAGKLSVGGRPGLGIEFRDIELKTHVIYSE